MQLKNDRKPKKKENIAYKINCKECRAVYVGETRTRSTAGQMMSEHQRAVEKRDQKSRIYKHYFETEGHRYDFDAVKIFATEILDSSRMFMGGVQAKLTNNVINRAESFPPIFSPLGLFQ